MIVLFFIGTIASSFYYSFCAPLHGIHTGDEIYGDVTITICAGPDTFILLHNDPIF
jgi:hypothetical protein